MRARGAMPTAIMLLATMASGCGTPMTSPPDASGPLPFTDEVDLLFMIDDSTSMDVQQVALVAELPRLVAALVAGDRDGDGAQDFAAVRSLHVAIVDSDMGLGGLPGIAGCSDLGNDGLMQFHTRTPRAGCLDDYASTYGATHVFDFASGGARSAEQVASDVGCVMVLGTAGCPVEFELDSPLKALSLTPTVIGSSPVGWTRPGYRPPTFFHGTFGHGDDPATNGAFLRPDSVLAIVTLNDEDDCSTGNPQIFSLDDPMFSTVSLNLRCHTWADHLYPVQRYVDGFLGLRALPGRLVYVPIAGVPPELVGASPSTILADPAMQETLNPANPHTLLPACVESVGGVAFPGHRMTELAVGLEAAGAQVSVQSICDDDLHRAADAIVGAVADALPM